MQTYLCKDNLPMTSVQRGRADGMISKHNSLYFKDLCETHWFVAVFSGMVAVETPSSKHQASEKHQFPSSNEAIGVARIQESLNPP